MKTRKTILSLLLCACMCFSLATPALAANESNTLGVTFSASLDKDIVQNGVDQVVTMTINASKGVTVEGIGATIVYDSPLVLTSIANSDERIDYTGSANIDTGIFGWSDDELNQYDNVINIATVTFTVPAGTAAGEYTVGIEKIELTKDYGDIWERTASATATLTVESPAPVEGYGAGISVVPTTIKVDDSVSVMAAVSHESDAVFAAGEMVFSYDPSMLEFNEEASTLGTAEVVANGGQIKLEDYGADKSFGDSVYVLSFTAIADGTTEVTLDTAAFSDKENAESNDLISATLSPNSATVVINKKTYTVTLPEEFTGNSEAIEGEDYTFEAVDKENYTYVVSATVNGTAVTVTDNEDGTYTIPGSSVNGEIVITAVATPNSYDVVIDSEDENVTGDANATYGEDYSFTLKRDEGYAYDVTITIDGVEYTEYTSVENADGSITYTIPGNAIAGKIGVEVTKTQTIASVTIVGSGAGAAAGNESSAKIGESYTLTITPAANYTYTVSAIMGGEAATVINNGNNTYTIENVTGNITFTVEAILIVDGVSANEYVTLNGTKMYLVKYAVTAADGKVPTYDGKNMFWSEKYNAYCYLVVADSLSSDDAKNYVGMTDGVATVVDYSNMDVNISGNKDANDAQLIYNMYNAMYAGFTDTVTLEKYLRADVNGSGNINVEDSAAVISSLITILD